MCGGLHGGGPGGGLGVLSGTSIGRLLGPGPLPDPPVCLGGVVRPQGYQLKRAHAVLKRGGPPTLQSVPQRSQRWHSMTPSYFTRFLFGSKLGSFSSMQYSSYRQHLALVPEKHFLPSPFLS